MQTPINRRLAASEALQEVASDLVASERAPLSTTSSPIKVEGREAVNKRRTSSKPSLVAALRAERDRHDLSASREKTSKSSSRSPSTKHAKERIGRYRSHPLSRMPNAKVQASKRERRGNSARPATVPAPPPSSSRATFTCRRPVRRAEVKAPLSLQTPFALAVRALAWSRRGPLCRSRCQRV